LKPANLKLVFLRIAMASTFIALTILLPWAGALAVWLVGDKRPKLQHTLAVGFAAAAGVAAILLLGVTGEGSVLRIPLGGVFGDISFVADGLGAFLTAVATVVGSLAVLFSVDYMRGADQLGRYYALVLFFIGGMVGLALTGSLLFLFFFWEITALCSYALISFYNDDPKAVAGGVKALIITSLGGVGLFAGSLAIYALQGSYDLHEFITNAHNIPAIPLAWLAFGFLAAAAAKSAQFPFQTWLPDAMEAPSPISALIHAATMVNAGVYLLARFYPAFEAVPGWRTAVIAVGVISALLAAFMATIATDLKRALAYSTVSQLGYMVYAVGSGGILASQFHLFSHAIFKALLFLGAGAVIHAVGTRDMRQMGGLGAKMPFIRNTFIIGALALAGLPILNGFWSKELILEAGLEGSPTWALAAMIFGAGLTALYTLRLTWLVFFGQERAHLHAHDAAPFMRIALGLLAAGVLTSWLLIASFSELLHETLPLHEIHELNIIEMATEIFAAPLTWVALAVIAAGMGLYAFSLRQPALGKPFAQLAWAAEHSFGFEWINAQVVRLTQAAAELLRKTQTGKLNWNVFGIVAGLMVVLAIMFFGQ
jgi:NADH-quinone oxidoreductase subunit L